MGLSRVLVASVLLFATGSHCAGPVSSLFDPAGWLANDIKFADAIVLGGGSAGAYGAIALKDAGKSVIVVEQSNRLGGHFDTYIDPQTKIPVDYGVQVVAKNDVSDAFFARFHIATVPWSPPKVSYVIADFTTGQNVTANPQADLSGYFAQLSKYPYVDDGTNFPNPPPADFSLSFGQFITKYGLQAAAFSIYSSPGCSGLGNVLNQPTVDVFRCLTPGILTEGSGGGLRTADNNFSELYTAIANELGSSVLYSSVVLAAQRTSFGVAVEVQTPSGPKLLLAKQILVAFPPDSQNMNPLWLDSKESNVFSRFRYNAWYTGLVKNTGLSTAFYLNAGANTQYHIPTLPGVYHLEPTADPGVFNYWYGADSPVSRSQVESDVFAAINKLTGKTQQTQVVAFSDHTPYNLGFSSSDIQAGLYTQFDALQGYRNTYYTGAVLALASGTIWELTTGIVQQMVAAM